MGNITTYTPLQLVTDLCLVSDMILHDSTHIMSIFNSYNSQTRGYAAYLTVSSTTLTKGTNSYVGVGLDASMAKKDTTHYWLTNTDWRGGSNDYLVCIIGTISSGVLTIGTKNDLQVFGGDVAMDPIRGLVGWSDTKAVCSWNYDACVLTCTDNDIVTMTELFDTNMGDSACPAKAYKLSDTRLLYIEIRWVSSPTYRYFLMASIYSVNITTPAIAFIDSETTLDVYNLPFSTMGYDVCQIDTSTYAIFYREDSNTYLSAILLTISGDTLSFGTECNFGLYSTTNVSATMISSTKFIVHSMTSGGVGQLHLIDRASSVFTLRYTLDLSDDYGYEETSSLVTISTAANDERAALITSNSNGYTYTRVVKVSTDGTALTLVVDQIDDHMYASWT